MVSGSALATLRCYEVFPGLRLEPKGQVSTITIGTPITFGSFGQFWPNNLAQFWPILAHFVTGVGSSNVTLVITFRNVL